MPRKGYIAKRKVEPDPVYGSDLVTKFVNSMMWQGKKSTAEGIFYEALTKLQEKGGDEPFEAVREGGGERQAAVRREEPPRGGAPATGSQSIWTPTAYIARHPLAHYLLRRTRRKGHDRQTE